MLQAGDVVVNVFTREVTWGEQKVELTAREFGPLEEVWGLKAIVQKLLLLVRADAGQLPLSLAREIAHAHGGELVRDPPRDDLVSFTLTLPQG